MSDILFSGKVVCKDCLKKHKSKKERGRRKYVCSTYDHSKGCNRNMVSQNQLLELLEMRYKRLLTKKEIDQIVDYILVSENNIEILLHNEKPIKLLENYAQF